MGLPTRYFCAVPFAKVLTLLFILVTYFDKGSLHVGERCLTPWCAKGAYCDMYAICRCRQDYPVLVNPEECRKGIRYGHSCTYDLECEYYDKNSSCHSSNLGQLCACNPGLIYDERRKQCLKVEENNTREVITSIIIGISTFIVIAFIGCLALKYCHKRCRRGETGFSQFCRRNPPASDVGHARTPSNEIIQINEVVSVENKEDLPPSYEEAVKQVVVEGKG